MTEPRETYDFNRNKTGHDMRLKPRIIAVLASSALSIALTGTAAAKACAETEFSSSNAELYLKAETALLVNDDPEVAMQQVEQLQNRDLNCYEQSAVLRLGGAAKTELGDYHGAVGDFELALIKGFVPDDEIERTRQNIAVLKQAAG